jgi:hypothetical protein
MRASKADDMAKLAAHLCTICDSPPQPEISLIAFGSPPLTKPDNNDSMTVATGNPVKHIA